MKLAMWFAVSVVVLIIVEGCGGGGSSVRPDCPQGQTSLDGTCVSQQIADYVGCIRATGATVASDNSRSLSAAAGAAGVTASTQAEVKDKLERRYGAVSDTNTLEIIHNCAARTGSASGRTDEEKATFHCFAYTFANEGAPGDMQGSECFASKMGCDSSQRYWSDPEPWSKARQRLLSIETCTARSEAFCYKANRAKGGPGNDWICRASSDFCKFTAPGGGCARYLRWPG